MEVKLVVSDIDGTLIDIQEKLSDSFYRLVETVKKNNCQVTLASGRCYDQIKTFIEALEIKLPVIINNGGGCFLDGNLIWDNVIHHSFIKEAIQKADSLNMVVAISDGYTDKVYSHNAYIQNQIDQFGRYSEILHPETEQEWNALKAQKLLIIDPQRPGKIDDVIDCLLPHKKHLNIVKYNDRSMDVMSVISTKANGVQRLADSLNISVKEIMAIGDAKNDIEMIELVGKGVAVANADEELKRTADYICKNENAKGVLEAIEKFYLTPLQG